MSKAEDTFPIGKYKMSPEQLGEVIRRVRKRQGLTQPQLAGAAGVGLRFLVELEGGKGTAQLGKALAVLDALGCKLVITTPEDARR
jgi:HTH-type transcriptional regulator / antitoxin HipB